MIIIIMIIIMIIRPRREVAGQGPPAREPV